MAKRLNLHEYEAKLKAKIEQNPNDDKIYYMIYYLVKTIAMRYHWIYPESAVVDLSTIAAENLYMLIMNGYKIDHWIAFIFKCKPSFLVAYRKFLGLEVYEPTLFDTKKQDPYEIFYPHPSYNWADKIEGNCFIDKLFTIIKSVTDEQTRFVKGSKEYENTLLSIYVSILYQRFISLFQSEDDKNYTKFLYNRIYEKVKEEIGNVSEEVKYGLISKEYVSELTDDE